MGKLSELPKFSCSSIYLTSLELEYCEHFFTLSTNNEHNQRKVGESILTIIVIAPLAAIMKPSSSDLE